MATSTSARVTSASGAEVQLRALQGLLVHADETLGEVDVGVGLLDGLGDELALQLDVLQRDLGELARGLGRGRVLSEVEEQLGERDLSGQCLAKITRDRNRGRHAADVGAQDRRLTARRTDRRRQLRQQRREGLIHAVFGGGVVAEARQDIGLVLERDRDGFVDGDRTLGEHFTRRRGRGYRVGGLKGSGPAEDDEARHDEDPSHVHAPSSAWGPWDVHFCSAR